MRAGWRLLQGLAKDAESPRDIVAATGLPAGIALRLWVIREAGGLGAIDVWVRGNVTVWQLERAIRWAPYDDDGQLRELRAASGVARATLKG